VVVAFKSRKGGFLQVDDIFHNCSRAGKFEVGLYGMVRSVVEVHIPRIQCKTGEGGRGC
jgi:hypothetical protein